MGRSRARVQSAEDDPNRSRAKRKKLPSSSTASLETAPTAWQETSPGKAALYHCNYCNKDLSGMIRIKCAVCPDFDLCVECFSVGAEVTPHRCNHLYRVMDNLSFPLICSDWNADEEMLLLEGIEMYGFGNWNEVSEHVGTKSRSQCIDHYKNIYINSPCFPLPDLSHVMGKSREEILALTKGESKSKKEFPAPTELAVKDESPFFERIKTEAPGNGEVAGQSSSYLSSEVGSHMDPSHGNMSSGAAKKTPDQGHTKDSVKIEENQSDRRIGEKKLRLSGDVGPSLTELSGYNFKRQEFENEYDNDAEQLLADMEFKDTDTDAEHELKVRVLQIYSKRLDERKRRKDFILERGLLYPDLFEKSLSPEEKEIYQRYKVFMRFHKKEEHEELMKSVIEDYRLVKRINDLQEARAAGCRTAAEAYEFIDQKRRKEAEESSHRVKESAQAGPSGKTLQSPRGVIKGPTFLPAGKDSASTSANQAVSRSLDDWDITGFPGADLLSQSEQCLCCEMRILPSHYLSMLQTLSVGIMKGTVNEKSDAHSLFKMESSKVDKVYDMLVKRGIPQA